MLEERKALRADPRNKIKEFPGQHWLARDGAVTLKEGHVPGKETESFNYMMFRGSKLSSS